MNYRFKGVLVILVVLLAGESLRAHHAHSIAFDDRSRVTLTGMITKIEWKNPHIQFSFDTKGGGALPEIRVGVWVMEGESPNTYLGGNVGKADFEKAMSQAATVTVEVSTARNGSRSGYLRKITFPDGRSR